MFLYVMPLSVCMYMYFCPSHFLSAEVQGERSQGHERVKIPRKYLTTVINEQELNHY